MSKSGKPVSTRAEIWGKKMKQRRNENGQALVMTALSMVVMLGFMALATDVGLLFHSKRNLQIAADAAATAAALDYLYNGSATSAVSAGQAAAAANGVTNGSGGAVVTINDPPLSGPNAGTAGFFEAIVSTPNPTFFVQAITSGGSFTVAARAVAATPSNSNDCIYISNPTASDVFHLQGSATLSATNCNIYVNSNSASAVKVTGNSSTVSAGTFDVVGGYSGHQTSPTPITTNSPTQSDPLGNLTGPTPPGACTTTSTATTVSAGALVTTAGGVVCFTNAVTLNNGVVMSGSTGGTVYVFENGVTIATGATVTFGSGSIGSATNGAVMDLYGGTLNQNSNSLLNSFAPTSGTYNGVSILQPLSNTTTPLQVQFGSNNETLDGMIYAPGVEVDLQDNGGGVTASGVFANTMVIKSSSLTIPSYSAANGGTTPLRIVSMVE